MSPRRWEHRASDIIESVDLVEGWLDGLDLATFSADQRLVDAVEMRLLIIGEASLHIPEEVRARAPEVPWQALRGLRNRLVHEYFRVRVETLWETAKVRLPELRVAVGRLLAAG